MRDFWRDIDATSRVAKDRRGVFAYELIAERARSEMALRSKREVERELPIRIASSSAKPPFEAHTGTRSPCQTRNASRPTSACR
jgi:hypothetical protein